MKALRLARCLSGLTLTLAVYGCGANDSDVRVDDDGDDESGAVASELHLTGAHWEATAPMATARESHTATRLRSGKVLVAGGSNGAKLASSELYGPQNDQWTSTSSLHVARSNHTATRLRSGKVLVAGGSVGGGTVTAAAEIYDPQTGQWTLVAPMNQGRTVHSATLLRSGKVLVAGGLEDGEAQVTSTAEIYDPATNTWTTTGSMSTGRASYDPSGGAVRLCDGRVMFVGDDANGTGEIYNPATGNWSATASLPFPIANHSVTLLRNCDVLVAGGQKLGVPFEEAGTLETRTYDPGTNTWTRAGDLHHERYFFNTGVLRSGQVVILGGSGVTSDPTAAEVYNPATRQWHEIAGPSIQRFFATVTTLQSGELFFVGGSYEDYEASTEVLRLN